MPSPMEVSSTTAAMPTEIPSMVNRLRSLWLNSELWVNLRKSRVSMLMPLQGVNGIESGGFSRGQQTKQQPGTGGDQKRCEHGP